MQQYFNNVVNRTGDVIPGALVTVTNTATGELAELFVDNGVTRGPNPVVTDNNGFFSFYVDSGRYSFTISGGGIGTLTIPDVSLEDASVEAADAAASAAAAALSAASAAAATVFVQSGTGAVTRTIQNKAREIVSVKDFGAVGDGVTDDTVAEQAAIDHLVSLGGGDLLYPPGVYNAGPVYVTGDNIRMVGYGATLKLKSSPGADQFGRISAGILSNKTTTVAISSFAIEGFEIDGNKANQLQGSGVSEGVNAGLFVYTCSGLVVKNLKVHDCDGYGIGLVGTDLAGRSDFRVENVETYDNSYDGLDIKGGTTNRPLRIVVDGVYSHDNGGGAIVGREAVGIDLRGQYIAVRSCTTENNQNVGLRVRATQAYDCRVSDHTSLSNSSDGIRIDGIAGEGPYILKNCISRSNTGSGFRLEQTNVILQGCQGSLNTVHGVQNNTDPATIQASDCIFAENDQDGINVSTTSDLSVANTRIVLNGRDGIRSSGVELRAIGNTIKNNGALLTGRGVNLIGGAGMLRWLLQGNTITDDQGVKTQTHAVAFSTAPPAGQLLDNNLAGNLTGVLTGTIPSGTIRRDNIGYKTQGTYISSTFAIDSTGVKSVTIDHDLAVTPRVQDCALSLVRSANNVASTVGFMRLVSTTSALVSAQANVTVASGTGGDTAQLSVVIDASVAA